MSIFTNLNLKKIYIVIILIYIFARWYVIKIYNSLINSVNTKFCPFGHFFALEIKIIAF